MSNVHATLQQRLSATLKAHPDPLRVIAKRSGYSASYIAALAGHRTSRQQNNPSVAAVWAIAEALGVDPLWLLGN